MNKLPAALILLFFVSRLPAADEIFEFQLKKIGAIRIQSDGPVDEIFLRDLIELTPNVDILTSSKVRKSVELLYRTGEFTNIQVDAQMVDDRVDLTFILRTVYRIDFIHLEGKAGIPERRIRRRISLRKLEPYTPEKVMKGREEILQVLHENGYLDARVNQDVMLFRKKKRAELVYNIQAGAPSIVSRLSISGTPVFPLPSLKAALDVESGDRYAEPRFNRSLEKLNSFYNKAGYIEHRIESSKQEAGEGNLVDLDVRILPGKQLLIRTDGYPISGSRLRQHVPIWSEQSYNEDTLEEGRRNLIHYLQTEGFYDAKVTWVKEENEAQILITYRIDPGTHYKIDHIYFSGNDHISRNELLDILLTKESGAFGANRLVTKIFEEDQERILGAYRLRGFLFARLVGKEFSRLPGNKIQVDLKIDEGPQSVVSEIRFEGNEAVSTAHMLENLQQKILEPVSEAKVKTDSTYIVALYSDRGYPKVQIDTKLLFSQDKTRVILGYRIKEGEQIFVDRIVMNGNYRTSRHVIEESLYFSEDEPLSLRKLSQSQSKLYGLNIFDRVDIQVPRPDNLQKFQNVFVRLTEARPYTLSYGFGYQTFDKLRGIFGISNRNLYGTGRSISFQARGGLKQALILLSYVDPHLLFHKLTSSVIAFVERGDRTSFAYDRYGARFQIERKLHREAAALQFGDKPQASQSLFLRYDFEDNTIIEGEPSLEPQDRPFLAIHLSAVSGGYVRDGRDNDIDPTRGNYLSTDLQWATHFLGSEPDFLKSFSQFQYYVPVKNTVVATSLRLGVARAFELTTDELPLSQRFFAGGGRTIRGFELDTAGPLDEDGEPLGGNSLFILNLEYRFPILGNLRGVAFFDYGNVFSLVDDFSFPELRKTTGVGIRYMTPIGPLTIDWGYKLDRKREPVRESASEFFFSVGHAF